MKKTPSPSRTGRYIRVALPVPVRDCFDYWPAENTATPGMRVKVPFGRRHLIGMVMEISDQSAIDPAKIRQVTHVIDDAPLLPDLLFGLIQWVARYYHYPIGDALFTALPSLLRQGRDWRAAPEKFWVVGEQGRHTSTETLPRAPLQAAILHALQHSDRPLAAPDLRGLGTSWKNALDALIEKGLVEETRPALDTPVTVLSAQSGPALSGAQQQAVEAIRAASAFQCFMLHGVTGSGKTEVYLRAAKSVLDAGRQVLILTPEIGLTPQLVQRFKARLDMPVSVMHSGQSDLERLNVWREARSNHPQVIIATRSGVFSPSPELGLIIVDEEHDLSYKQQDGLRYNARDVAIMRAQLENIPIVLGSATPSLESYDNCRRGKYCLLELPQRAGQARPPAISLLDMRKTPVIDGLSPQLLAAIREQLDKHEQTLLFLNRRGYAPALYCADCGWVAYCPRCDAHLTLHKRANRLRCHHCGTEIVRFQECQNCGGKQLAEVGEGTERIEDALALQLGKARLLRIDRDSMARKDALEVALRQINNHEVDILIGTQMLSKGHHFPEVTLVGVINADGALYSTDFRAPERLFQAVTQVAGRAGRAKKPGRVLVQTHHPQHPVFDFILRQDYPGLAAYELAQREAAQYPPFTYLALMRAEALKENEALNFLNSAKSIGLDLLGKTHKPESENSLEISEAVPSPMEKRGGRWRAQLMLQSAARGPLHRFIDDWLAAIEKYPVKKAVRWSLDIDPMDML